MKKGFGMEFIFIGLLLIISLGLLQSPNFAVVAIVSIGLLQYHLVLLLHECVHSTLHPNRTLNHIVGKLSGALIFISFENYQKEHWAHHRESATTADPDFYIYNYQGPLTVPRILYWIFWRGLVEVKQKQRTKGLLATTHLGGTLSIVLAQLLIFFGLMFALKLSLFSTLLSYIMLWAFPLLAVAFFINRSRIIFEHGFGILHNNGIDLIGVPKIVRCFLFPFSFNYHHTHHLYPHTPSYQLQRLSLENVTNKVHVKSYVTEVLCAHQKGH